MQTNNQNNDSDVTIKNIRLEFSFEDEPDTDTPDPEEVEEARSASSSATMTSFDFTVSEMSGKQPLLDINETYVPRFSSASETTVAANSAKKPLGASVSGAGSIDPTTELDGGVDSYARVVAVNAPNEEKYEIQSTVFKFDDVAEEEPMVEAAPVTNELPTIEEPTPDPEPEMQSVEEKVYSIPDPVLPGEEPKEEAHVSRTLVPAQPKELSAGNNALVRSAEYTAHTQRDGIKDKFLDAIMSVKVRLWVSVALLAVLFFVENLWLFGVDVPKILGVELLPGNMALLDLHLVIALFALALPEFIYALRKLAAGRAVPELFMGFAAFATVFYTVVVIIKAPVEEYPLFGFLFGIMTISAIVSALYKKLAEFVSFKAISSSADKSIVERKLTRTLPEENHALDGRIEEYKSKIARVYRAEFISDFFKRSGKCSENSKSVTTLFFSILGVSFVSAMVAFFVASNSIYHASMVFALVVMLGLPTFSIISHKIPYFHACCEARVENSAIVGETALYDYAGVDVLTFRDTEIFTEEDVTLQRIMLYGKSENLEKAMHQMSAIFAVVGGPLETMFLNAIERNAPRASNISIEEDGILGEVGGCEIRAGSLEYMKRHGIVIPEDNSNESSSLHSTKIMYAAENGEVYAKFYIRYTLSEDCTMILPVLLDDGITPLVYTKDPNIGNDLFKSLTAGADNIRVLKRLTLEDEDEKVYNKVSAGLVTTGDKSNVINMLLLSKKYVRFQNRMTITEFSAAAVGSALAVIFALTGMTVIPAIVLSLWQIVWCAALFVTGKRTINESTNRSKDKK